MDVGELYKNTIVHNLVEYPIVDKLPEYSSDKLTFKNIKKIDNFKLVKVLIYNKSGTLIDIELYAVKT